MKKLDIILPKYLLAVIYIIGIITILNYFRGCSTSKEDLRMRKEIKVLSVEVDSLRGSIYTKNELSDRMEIQGLKNEKSILHNMNEIVLTNKRPAQRINEIDEKIKILEERIK